MIGHASTFCGCHKMSPEIAPNQDFRSKFKTESCSFGLGDVCVFQTVIVYDSVSNGFSSAVFFWHFSPLSCRLRLSPTRRQPEQVVTAADSGIPKRRRAACENSSPQLEETWPVEKDLSES